MQINVCHISYTFLRYNFALDTVLKCYLFFKQIKLVHKINNKMNSPESKKKKTEKYFTKFQDNWLNRKEYKNWLSKIDTYTAKCTLCSTKFTVKYDGEKAVRKHCTSKEHGKANSQILTNQILTNIFPSTSNFKNENLKIAAAVVAQIYHGLSHHHSYLSIECGIKLNNEIFKDSAICSKISCGRTKVQSIVENVICPKSIEMVLEEMRNLPFSNSIDASNKGNKKFFPLAVRYFHKEKGLQHKIIDFYEDADETSEAITKIKLSIEKNDLDIKNVVAYGADNASVNYGKNNSVYQNLKSSVNNNLIKGNCHCHILHNAGRHAIKALSYDVENLVAKVYAEFSNSAKKVEELKLCFDFVEMEYEKVRYSQIRWLSLFQAVERLLSSWPAIKVYFKELGKEHCHKVVWDFVNEDEHEIEYNLKYVSYPELYLYFVHHYMNLMTKSLLLTEKNNLTCIELDEIMRSLKEKLETRIKDKFFGSTVHSALKYIIKKDEFINEAIEVYKRTLNYLEKWYDYDKCIYKKMEIFNLKSNNFNYENILDVATSFNIIINEDKLYDEIHVKNLLSSINNNIDTLNEKWKKIFVSDEDDNLSKLLKIVRCILSIPVNNSYVEGIFSIMNNVWSDERNRLKVESVKTEICTKLNYKINCGEFYKYITKPEQVELLKCAISNKKYNFKVKK